MNKQFSELVAYLGGVNPDAYASAADSSSGYISAANFTHFGAVLQVGAIGISGSVVMKVEQASDSSGTGLKDLTSAVTTALTGGGGDGTKQAVINFAAADLDLVNGFSHFRITCTLADDGGSPTGLATDYGAAVYGIGARTAPASDNDASTVDEIVTV